VAWLRAVARHECYAPGPPIDQLIWDLRALRAERRVYTSGPQELPPDPIVQHYPGADVPHAPIDTLVEVVGCGASLTSNVVVAGSLLLVRTSAETLVRGLPVPFLMATAMDTPRTVAANNEVLVAWWVPPFSKQINFRGGKKKDVMDVFGQWTLAEELPWAALGTLPPPIVPVDAIICAGVVLSEESTIPYAIFDALRFNHNIDVTGLSMSLTRGGNLYRSYALMRGRT
jgi:hypothetical protein